MPFHESFWPVFQSMQAACKRLEIEPRRVDQLAHVENIHAAIFDEIEACDVVIADFSADRTPGHPNTNVITEAAHANAKGIPQIVLTQDPRTLTFDWATKRAIVYRNSDEGLAILVERLTDALRETKQLRAESGAAEATRPEAAFAPTAEGPLPRAVAVLLEQVEEAWHARDLHSMRERLERVETRGYRMHREAHEWWINYEELRDEAAHRVLDELVAAWTARDLSNARDAFERLLQLLPADHPKVVEWPQTLAKLEDELHREAETERAKRAAYAALPEAEPVASRVAAHESFLRQYPDAPEADDVRRVIEACSIPLAGHKDAVSSVAFVPDGRWILTGSHDCTAKLWRLESTGEASEARTLAGHTAPVNAVAISADGHWALTGSGDCTVRVWRLDGHGGASEAGTLFGHTEPVVALALSANGRWLLTGAWDCTVKLWRLDGNGRADEVRTHWDPAGEIHLAALSPDGCWALTGSNHTVKLSRLDGEGNAYDVHTFRGHKRTIRAVDFSPDGRWVLTGSRDHTAKLWRLDDDGNVRETDTLSGHEGPVESVAFSADGRWALTGSGDGTAKLWRLEAEGEAREVRTLSDHPDGVLAVAFSPDHRWAVTGSGDGTARLWRLLEMAQ